METSCRWTALTATRLLDNRRIFFPGNGPVHAAAGEGDLSLDCPHRDKSRNGEPDNPPHPARAPRSWLAHIPGRHGPRLHKAITLWHSGCSKKGSGLFGARGRFRLKGSHGSAVLPAARVRGSGHPDAGPSLSGSSEQGGCAIHHGGDRSRWPVCPRPSLCGLSGTLRRQMVERGLRMKGRMRLTATTGATGCRPGLGRPPVR